MEAAVQALVDRQEIATLCKRYARALDTRDWDLLASCFTDPARYTYPGGRTEGFGAIRARCEQALTRLTASQHLLGNIEVELVGADEARSVCYFQAQHVLTGTAGGDNFQIGGTYRDRVVRTSAGWRIAERDQTYTWFDGNRAVVSGPTA